MATWYVDGDNGSDYEDATFTDGTYDDVGHAQGNYVVEKTGAFSNLTSGDRVYVEDNGSGNIAPGAYEVHSVDLFGNWVRFTSSLGSDAVDVKMTQADGSSEALAYNRIQKAIDESSSGDIVYIQNNGSTVYEENVSLSDKRLKLIGYGSSTDDDTIVEIDGTDVVGGDGLDFTQTTDGPDTIVLRNLYIHDFDAEGVHFNRSGGSNSTLLYMINCRASNNGNNGVYIQSSYNSFHAVNCEFDNNGDAGVDSGGRQASCVLCRAYDNGDEGFRNSTSYAFTCVLCEATGNVDGFAYTINILCSSYNNTGDGEQGIAEVSYWIGNNGCQVLNGFTHSGLWGMDPSWVDNLFSLYNGFYSNSSGNIDGTPEYEKGSLTDDPEYLDHGSNDNTLKASSPWRRQEIPLGLFTSSVKTYPAIGARQPSISDRKPSVRMFA